MDRNICAILGVGPKNGLSFAKVFSENGYHVALCSRGVEKLKSYTNQIKNSYAFEFDASDVEAPSRLFGEIRNKLGPVDVVIYNAGAGQFANIDDATLEGFQNAWEINARGLFLTAKEVVKDMRKSEGMGNIVVIGATASLRGGANFVPFASAKAAQRSLAQSLARYLGPENIHVSYVNIDGVIGDGESDKEEIDKGSRINPDDIAESVYFLTCQPKSAWTFELDLRPYREKW